MSAITFATSSFFEKIYRFVDTSYTPMDMDRTTIDLIKKKLADKK
jgi:hypothetical protein